MWILVRPGLKREVRHGKRAATMEAGGLLCRMYLGWKRDNPALQRGVAALSKKGPSAGNMEYNYFATQALYRCRWSRGLPKTSLDDWTKWDTAIHEKLLSSQATEGHQSGSWFFDGNGKDLRAQQGGRLYCTAMAAWILEVRYSFYVPIAPPTEEMDFPE